MGLANTKQPSEDFPRCPLCGNRLTAGKCPRCPTQKIFPWVRREIWLLVLVAAATVPLYVFTRGVAIQNRDRKARAAAYWFDQGQQQLRAGNSDTAIVSFRRATVNDRENFLYGLALANALAVGGHPEEARFALLRLRDSAPEHSEINLQLARLAAKRGDVNGAVHYYRNALYGVWPDGSVEQRRREARLELIHFLLDRGEHNIALSELLLLSSELPENSESYTEVARLLLQAGDPQQALAGFRKAMELDRKNGLAQAGAGEAAFQLQDYRTAIRYLQAALALDQDLEWARELLEISGLTLLHDPLAPRLSQQERDRRLIDNFKYVFEKLENCRAQEGGNVLAAKSDLEALHAEAVAIQPRLRSRTLRREPQLPDVAMNLISRILEATSRSCGEPSSLDRALLLIGRSHQGGEA